jgi:hypothetical protein
LGRSLQDRAATQYTGVDRSGEIIETFDVQFVNKTFIR